MRGKLGLSNEMKERCLSCSGREKKERKKEKRKRDMGRGIRQRKSDEK